MTTNTIDRIRAHFGGRVRSGVEKTPGRYYFEIEPKDLVPVSEYLYNDLRLRFIIASGVDTRHAFEILYHWADDPAGLVISFLVTIEDREKPAVDSLAPMMKGAAWIEREIHEMLGIDFKGNPNLSHLLLSHDWPAGDYPLRQNHGRK